MKKGVDTIGIASMPFVHDGSGNYLVGLRTKACRDEHDKWEFTGGGGVRVGETVESALKRELREEINAMTISYEFLGHGEWFREQEGLKTHWVTFDYLVKVDPKEIKIMEPEKCAELLWCSLEDIPQPRHSLMSLVLEKYKDKL